MNPGTEESGAGRTEGEGLAGLRGAICTCDPWGTHHRLGHGGGKMTHGGRRIKMPHFPGRKFAASGSRREQMKQISRGREVHLVSIEAGGRGGSEG